MHIRKLSVLNYKNIEQVDISLNQKLNCFVGNNGEGKTNLLDAIHYLSMCKSYFNSEEAQNINHNADFFVIEGNYSKEEQTLKVFCGIQRNSRKKIKLDGKEYERISDHIGLIPVVIISPSDTRLILDGGEERRKYMNSVISQYDRKYLREVIKYNRNLQQRNKLLKNFADTNSFNKEMLDVYNEQLVSSGIYIYEKRTEFIERLLPVFQRYYTFVSQGKEDVNLIYRSDLTDNTFLDLLNYSLQKDRIVQHTTVGIHKDDLILELGNNSIKKYGSQGQKKTFLIALKLAQFEFIKNLSKVNPILLLDDIFDKLDGDRVEQFIKLVADNNFGQIFITDTNFDRLNEILIKLKTSYKIFSIKKGEIIDEKE